ncbi:MAG: DUF4277 domain-containing protein [Gloeotrichia echinulata CP02]|jgi:hypothetical protein
MDYQKEEIESKNLDHLGIIAGIIDDIGIVEKIGVAESKHDSATTENISAQ